ncbi:MAG: hypothetical protein M3R48_08825 [Candidatus Dormibacteraeota bacterium]|nr:hypothetical protein [Candidatus Dormibacteraeota bacterium]
MSREERADRLWHELMRTADVVRTDGGPPVPDKPGRRSLVVRGVCIAAVAGLVAVAVHAASSPLPVRADGSADAVLFSLVNQDRASNGVRSVSGNGTLGSIGEGARYTGCPGLTVYGRSVDMIQRNYFAHPILNCGQVVFSMMSAFGVHYRSAGENIGWTVGGSAGAAASVINSSFMNSPDHRSNILNGNYTTAGVGSDNSGSAAWTGGGGSYTSAWMFSEEFAQVAGSSPPPPPPPPPPHRSGPPVRNVPAPVLPALAPASTAPPTASPTAVPTALPTATSTPFPGVLLPPGLEQTGGLLYDSIESVLESYLIA